MSRVGSCVLSSVLLMSGALSCIAANDTEKPEQKVVELERRVAAQEAAIADLSAKLTAMSERLNGIQKVQESSQDSSARYKDRYLGKWKCVNRFGTMRISDVGDKLMIVDDHDQRFTATIKANGELDCPFFGAEGGGMSYIAKTGHLLQPNGEFEKVGQPSDSATPRAPIQKIHDAAGLFSAEVSSEGEKALNKFEKDRGLELVIETFDVYPGTDKPANTRDAWNKAFGRIAAERRKALDVNGTYLLLCKEPRWSLTSTSAKGLTSELCDKLQKAIRTSLGAKDFDGCMRAIESVLEGKD